MGLYTQGLQDLGDIQIYKRHRKGRIPMRVTARACVGRCRQWLYINMSSSTNTHHGVKEKAVADDKVKAAKGKQMVRLEQHEAYKLLKLKMNCSNQRARRSGQTLWTILRPTAYPRAILRSKNSISGPKQTDCESTFAPVLWVDNEQSLLAIAADPD